MRFRSLLCIKICNYRGKGEFRIPEWKETFLVGYLYNVKMKCSMRKSTPIWDLFATAYVAV